MKVYIFGKFNNGFSACPDDSASNIIKDLYKDAKAETQIIIRRDGNTMYYGYIRKLKDKKYIGLCIAYSDYMVINIDSLFPLFENAIERMAMEGNIISFSHDRKLITNVCKLQQNIEDVFRERQKLKDDFISNCQCTKLPSCDYGIAKDSKKEFNIKDNEKDIIQSSHTFGFTYIYKDEDYNTIHKNSYQAILKELNNQINQMEMENIRLRTEIVKIKKQKKQFTIVIVLALFLVLCTLVTMFLFRNLNSTHDKLSAVSDTLDVARWEIDQLDSIRIERDETIETLNSTISSLNDTAKALKDTIAKKEYHHISMSYYQPIIVKNAKLDFHTGKYEFDYYAFKDINSCKLKFRASPPINKVYSYERTLPFTKGDNHGFIFVGNKIKNNTQYIEILYNERIIGGSVHSKYR